MSLPTNPSPPPLPENTRLDPASVCAPDPIYGYYKIDTGPLGNYYIEYAHPNYVGKQSCVITTTGDHSYTTLDNNGTENHNSAGGYKHASMNETHTVMGHKDAVNMGGHREVNQQGKHEENAGGGKSDVSQSVHITSATDTHTVLSPSGHGHHVINGDQTFQVVEGGMYYQIDNDYTITTSNGALALHSNKEITINSQKDLGSYIGGNGALYIAGTSNTLIMGDSIANIQGKSTTFVVGAINITSEANISFIVGSSSIVLTSSGIIIKGGTITVQAASGDLDLNASGSVVTLGTSTKLQGGGSSSPPATIT